MFFFFRFLLLLLLQTKKLSLESDALTNSAYTTYAIRSILLCRPKPVVGNVAIVDDVVVDVVVVAIATPS